MHKSEQVGSVTMLQGHVLEVLGELSSNSVQVVVTSPPYFNLRRYQGVDPVIWGGNDPTCEHSWVDLGVTRRGGLGGDQGLAPNPNAEVGRLTGQIIENGDTCSKCGAWRGCLGLEPTVAQFIQNLVTIFREVRRVLRPDGICWINLGDSYAGSGKGTPGKTGLQPRAWLDGNGGTKGIGDNTLPRKNTQLVPFRLAIGLQEDGWIVRSVLPWVKRACQPESINDRPTVAHEYWLMCVKNPKYYYDAQAIRRSMQPESAVRYEYGFGGPKLEELKATTNATAMVGNREVTVGRNFRTTDSFFDSLEAQIAYLQDELAYFVRQRDLGGALVDADGDLIALDVPTIGTSEQHFATYNERIVSPFLRVSTSTHGSCATCGAPWVRLVAPSESYAAKLGRDWSDDAQDSEEGRGHSVSEQRPTKRGEATTAEYQTTGWAKGCKCETNGVRPGIALDPFSGTATTQIVAHKLGLQSIYIDQSPDYYKLAKRRLQSLPPANLEQAAQAERLSQLPLLALDK